MNLKDLLELQNFVQENKQAGGLDKSKSDQLETLWNAYKLAEIEEDCSIICADFGTLGSIEIRDIDTFEPKKFKYESGSYDYVSVKTNCETVILWADYKNIEPYNRQSGLYAGGSSFESLGAPTIEKPEYREFNKTQNYKSNIGFGVWGYRYNDFYNSVNFGICLKTVNVPAFIAEVRKIIGKTL